MDTETVSSIGELLETQTSDGLRLNGFWQIADRRPDALVPDLADVSSLATGTSIDGRMAWIVVHGVAGNFYNSSLLAKVAETLRQCGDAVLRINTRGRDPVAYFARSGSSERIGAAYEILSESQLDLEAWVGVLHQMGIARIGLVGHSLGAVKSVWYVCQASSSPIERLICLSPPRLATDVLKKDTKHGGDFQRNLQLAREHVDRGHPETLISIRYPQPLEISAKTFLDKYGSADRYDYLRWSDQISIPCLWCFGEQEVRGSRASFRDADRALASVLSNHAHHQIVVIPRADHAYTLAREDLTATIDRWISEKI